MKEWTFIPTFFLPVLGWRPTPLKMVLEKIEMVVESMMRRRFIHSSVPLRRLSEEMCTFAHRYLCFGSRLLNNDNGLTPANGNRL